MPGSWRHIRAALIRKQRNRCHYCSAHMGPPGSGQLREATLDHVVPQALGGKTEEGNVVAACRVCNEAKGDLMPEEFAAVLAALRAERAA